MQLPWVSRREMEQVCRDAEIQHNRAVLAEQRYADHLADSDKIIGILRNELEAVRADNKSLIERVLTPPVPIEAPAQQPKPVEVGIPGPETRVSFADVHKAARTAIKNKTIGVTTTKGAK